MSKRIKRPSYEVGRKELSEKEGGVFARALRGDDPDSSGIVLQDALKRARKFHGGPFE